MEKNALSIVRNMSLSMREKDMDWDQKKVYVLTLIDVKEVKERN